ncbi:aquaporin-like protein [Crassisporium funariophilum]|nr:aquaporin-like protein [Crassisporium funariophilum]
MSTFPTSPRAATRAARIPSNNSNVPVTTRDSEPHLPVLTTYDAPTRLNTWTRLRLAIREPLAEFIGVAIFVIFGAGADCQVVLSTDPNVTSSHKGEYLSINFGWAIGLAMGVWVSAGISGGHVNPAITLALATWRGFPWRKVPGAYVGLLQPQREFPSSRSVPSKNNSAVYIFAQVMGGLVGAALVYAQYFHAIDIFEGSRGTRTQATGGLFATYALDYMTAVSCFFAEFLGTAILVFMIMAATDTTNAAPPIGLLPLVIFLTLLGLGAALGMQTAFAFNPARDFGPRLFLSMAGYGRDVYTYRRYVDRFDFCLVAVTTVLDGSVASSTSGSSYITYGRVYFILTSLSLPSQYWLWCPILAPVAGAQAAVALYDLFLRGGADPIVPTEHDRP